MEQNAETSLSSAYSWKDLGLKRKILWIIGSKRSNDKVLKQLSRSLSLGNPISQTRWRPNRASAAPARGKGTGQITSGHSPLNLRPVCSCWPILSIGHHGQSVRGLQAFPGYKNI